MLYSKQQIALCVAPPFTAPSVPLAQALPFFPFAVFAEEGSMSQLPVREVIPKVAFGLSKGAKVVTCRALGGLEVLKNDAI